MLKGLLGLLRPGEWVKNVFVFPPLVFSGQFHSIDSVIQVAIVFVLFCLASSASYVVNDIRDVEEDGRHPVKSKTRPLVSGQVSIFQAWMLAVGIYVFLAFNFLYLPDVMVVIFSYLLLNLVYTYYLKHQPVIDIFAIASGFVLRVYAGAVALSVPVSSWMFVTTLSLTLYLAAIKRRQEIAQGVASTRKVLAQYSLSLVDKYAQMSAIGALLFYSLFVITDRPELVVTIPVVMYGMFRYWYIVETLGGGESPTEAFYKDWHLIMSVIIWVLICGWFLWPGNN